MGINDIVKIGDYFKQIRIDNKLSQSEFANRLNIPRSTYANYESNKREPNVDIIDKIDAEFGVNIITLVSRNSNQSIRLHGDFITVQSDDILEAKFNEFLQAFINSEIRNGNEIPFISANDIKALQSMTISVLRNFTDYMCNIPLDYRMENIKNESENNDG